MKTLLILCSSFAVLTAALWVPLDALAPVSRALAMLGILAIFYLDFERALKPAAPQPI